MIDDARIWITEETIDKLTQSFVNRYDERKGEIAELNRKFRFPNIPSRFHSALLVGGILSLVQSSADGRVLITTGTLTALKNLSPEHVDDHIDYLRNAVAELEPVKPVKSPDPKSNYREYLIWGGGGCVASLFIVWLLSN